MPYIQIEEDNKDKVKKFAELIKKKYPNGFHSNKEWDKFYLCLTYVWDRIDISWNEFPVAKLTGSQPACVVSLSNINDVINACKKHFNIDISSILPEWNKMYLKKNSLSIDCGGNNDIKHLIFNYVKMKDNEYKVFSTETLNGQQSGIEIFRRTKCFQYNEYIPCDTDATKLPIIELFKHLDDFLQIKVPPFTILNGNTIVFKENSIVILNNEITKETIRSVYNSLKDYTFTIGNHKVSTPSRAYVNFDCQKVKFSEVEALYKYFYDS